ncbi:MAG: methylated-DNA--[protein]-cysteine S-methyltransferase [Tannerellaceae bacterium]|nr:methylated-DNA--[protein]-cysteine S-methyltransferase [Tannerellaceae bacterium]
MSRMNTIYMQSPVGWIELQASETHLCGCRSVAGPGEATPLAEKNPVLQEAVKQLTEYFDRKRTTFELPLQQQGTPYQQTVWNELLNIPYGKCISYKELAARTGNAKACRAAGSANGKNNIFIIVPCHRVIQSNGTLGGFAYGLEMKQFLLDLEKTTP